MRAATTFLFTVLCSAATAADPPPIPPILTVARVEKDRLIVEAIRPAATVRETDVTVIRNGQPEVVKQRVTVTLPVVEKNSIALKGVKAVRGGKTLAESELAELLAEETPIVVSVGPAPEKYRKMFKDDAIFVEFRPQSQQ